MMKTEVILVDTHIVFYDAQCPLCRTVKTVISSFDWRHELSWFPVQHVSEKTREKASKIVDMYDEIYVLTKEEEVLIGFQSIRKILSVLPAFFWLAFLMKPQIVEWIGKPTYQFISSHRHQWFGRLSYEEAMGFK
jgi:predicted DCC family thiol-disulfide oxidoreductase YuxK